MQSARLARAFGDIFQADLEASVLYLQPQSEWRWCPEDNLAAIGGDLDRILAGWGLLWLSLEKDRLQDSNRVVDVVGKAAADLLAKQTSEDVDVALLNKQHDVVFESEGKCVWEADSQMNVVAEWGLLQCIRW